jgi:RimJ/RimL family protein N-acetyltransferase
MVYDKVIEGKTIRLRSIRESDAEVTYKMRSDPEKTQYIHAAQGTVEDQRQYIRKQMQEPGDYLFIIEDLSGKPLGMKGLYHYDPDRKEIESGRFLSYGSQLQNIEALMLGFKFAFDILQVDKIRMAALETNTGMLSIQKRIGAVFTGERSYVTGMGCDNIFSELYREKYEKEKASIIQLIDRFAIRK